ncbi:MAG TPA: hypothetical protein VF338_00815, partial [Leptolinea sp.]
MENEKSIMRKEYPKWIYLPIFLAPIILYLPALLPGKSLFWGITSLQFIPWHWEALQAIQAGVLPLWNPLNGLGAPLAANYQSALFYPPTWLVLIAGWLGGITWMAWAHGLLIVLHLIWAGWGMKSLTEYLGVSPIPQIICGLSFGLCGYLVARGGFLTMVQAASWIPWILLAASHIAAPIRLQAFETSINWRKPVIWLSVAFSGQWLSGHAQLAWYTLLFSAAWLSVGGIVNGGLKRLFQVVILTIFSGIIAFLLCSIQLIPTIELFLQSQRSGAIDYQTALSYSFWPWRFITLFLPDIFGNPGAGDYWGYASFWEDANYFGLLPLFFAFYFIFRWGKNRTIAVRDKIKPFISFSLISSFIIIILALGWNTPVFPWLFAHIPTFGLFNGPTRWMILVVVCFILLAGFGAEEWMQHGILHKKQINLGLTAALAMIFSGIGVWYLLPEIKFSFKISIITAGFLIAGYLILALIKPKTVSASDLFHWRLLFVFWLTIDLIWAGFRLNPAINSAVFAIKNPQSGLPGAFDIERYYWNSSDERDQRFSRFFKFTDIRPVDDIRKLTSTYLPDINILSSVSTLNNFDPILPVRFTNFLNEIESAKPENRNRYLELANVKWMAAVNPSNLQEVRWQKIDANPRIKLISCAKSVENGTQSLEWLRTAIQQD